MNKLRTLNRRNFLVGAGGFALAVPTLGSLRPREASAQVARQKRFVMMASDHGGVWTENFYPDMPAGATTTTLFPAIDRAPEHEIQWGDLSAQRSGGRARISNTLEAADGVLSEGLLGKMNVIAGLDMTMYLAHHRGHLGNFGAADAGINVPMMATIDQLMASSPGFAVQAARQRTMNFSVGYYGAGSGLRYTMSTERVGGQLVPVQSETDAADLWEQLFQDAVDPGPSQPLVVDRVVEHYRSMRDGVFGDATRLSSADRRRLDDHMERLFELQRRITVQTDCGQPDRPSYSPPRQRLENVLDLFSVALSCGASHIGVLGLSGEEFTDETGWTNWHEQVAHVGGALGGDSGFQRINYLAQREIFERAFVGLANRLDFDPGDGQTVLDDTLIVWTMESGPNTHDNVTTPVVTAGGAGGAFHTGRFLDLRNFANRSIYSNRRPELPGTLYNRFLSNIMRGMGVAPSEWQAEFQRAQPSEFGRGIRGYGAYQYGDDPGVDYQREVWPEAHYRQADDPLPGFAVGA